MLDSSHSAMVFREATGRGLPLGSASACPKGGNERAALADRSFPTTCVYSELFESVLEGVVDQVGVDLGGRQIPVPERPLNHQDIAGTAVEVGGEGVPLMPISA